VKLTTHIHLVLMLGMRGAIPPLLLYVMTWRLVKHRDNFTLIYFSCLFVPSFLPIESLFSSYFISHSRHLKVTFDFSHCKLLCWSLVLFHTAGVKRGRYGQKLNSAKIITWKPQYQVTASIFTVGSFR